MNNFFSGSAALLLGILIGALAGLSASEVVGSVLAVLLTSATVFLSLAPKKKDDVRFFQESAQVVYTLVFLTGLLCALFAGIWVRVAQPFFGSAIEQQYSDLKAIGISELRARNAILAVFEAGKALDNVQPERSTVVFSGSASNCSNIPSPEDQADYESVKVSFSRAGDVWAEAATAAEALPEDQRISYLRGFYDVVC